MPSGPEEEQEPESEEAGRHVPGLSLVGCGTLGECPRSCVLPVQGLYVPFWHRNFFMPPIFSF